MRLDFSGMRVTVMGLGVHGGGLDAARYLVNRGATVTVTDLRDEADLAASVSALPAGVRTVLGRHEAQDFHTADLVVKNPAVPRTAPMLRESPRVTTDIALFLAEWRSGGTGPLVAVTGTKGKSSTASAAAHILAAWRPGTRLGGNITVSPLRFVDELGPADPVVLELSSFQLGDLAFCREFNGSSALASLPEAVFHPHVPADVAMITNIYRDHQDYYGSMEAYVADKREIYRHLAPGATAIFGERDHWDASFVADVKQLTSARRDGIRTVTISPSDTAALPDPLLVPGEHNRINVAFAAAAAAALGAPETTIRTAATTFPGVPHRLEVVRETPRLRIVNDSAATIPEAALAAVRAFSEPTVLIAGGSDKGLDPAPIVQAGAEAADRGGALVLLDGTATPAIVAALAQQGVSCRGPAGSLEAAMEIALQVATEISHPRVVVLLSPGCASFGMFRNEFDRGDQFRAIAGTIE